MSRLLRWVGVLAPLLLLGADCPGSGHVDHPVRIHVLPAGVPSSIRPPAVTETQTVRFRQETATHDVVLDEGLPVEGLVLAPPVDASVDPDSPATVGTAAVVVGRERSGRARFTLLADDQGQFALDRAAPGTYDLQVFADEFVGQYAAAYRTIEVPGEGLVEIELEYGYPLTARVAEYDLISKEWTGIGSLAVEAYAEDGPGELRHAGPRTETDDDGAFTLYLPEGEYTLRFATPSFRAEGETATSPVPFPTGLITGFRVPEDIDALAEEVEEDELPVVYAYPRFARHSLSGTLQAVGPQDSDPENNAAVTAWGVVHAPLGYEGLDEVDFVVGPLIRKVFSNDSGDFAFGAAEVGLPTAVYSMDVVPGFDSDAAAQRWTGEQAIDLSDDRQLGTLDLTARVDLWVGVLDDQDRPVEGARVELHDLGLSRYAQALVSDENGICQFQAGQGPHRVLAFPPEGSNQGRSLQDIEIGTSTQVHFAVLDPGIQVTGQVALGFDLLEGVTVRFYDPVDDTLLAEGRTGRSGTYELNVPRPWAWPELDDAAGDDDDSAE